MGWGDVSAAPKTPKDFTGITRRLDEARETARGPEAKHVLTVREQIDAIARGDYDGALDRAHQDLSLEIF